MKFITLFLGIILLTGYHSVSAAEIESYSTPTSEWTEKQLWDLIGLRGVPCQKRKEAVEIIWKDKLQACQGCGGERAPKQAKKLRKTVARKLIISLSNTYTKNCFYFGKSTFSKVNSIDELLE